MRKKQLQAQRADLLRQANAALDAAIARAQAAGGGLSDEEKAAQDSFKARIADLDSLLAAEDDRTQLQAQLQAPVPDAGPVPSASSSPRPRVEVGDPNVARDPRRGFANLGEFGLAIREASRPDGMARIDARLLAAPTSFHQESGSPEGGMVPPEFRNQIWQLVFDDPLLGLIVPEPTNSNVVELLADESTPWGATGVQANWRAEGVQMTPSKLATAGRQVRLHELYAFVLATEELLEDAPRLNDRLSVQAPRAIRWKLIESFMWGTGAGQPLGWAHASNASRVLVTRSGAGLLDATDVGNVYKRLLVEGSDRSFWVANRDTITKLITMVLGQSPVWLPPTGMAGAPGGTLLGRPLFFSEHCQTLGTAGDLQLINPDGYYALQRGQARQDVSMHLYFDYALTAFRWMFRFGGQPLLSAAVAAAKGSNTKSHFVILNT